MKKRSVLHGIAIRPDQVALLKAALFPPDEALRHWAAWKRLRALPDDLPADDERLPQLFDPLDLDSQRLLPLVYRNLERTADPLVRSLRGVYRYTWMANQRHLLQLKAVVGVLDEAGIPTMMLKGIPLSLAHYRDLGVRHMGDLDVLVPTEHAEAACHLLEGPPLRLTTTDYDRRYRHLLHAAHYHNRQGVDVDLHWNLLVQHNYPGADAAFWAASTPYPLEDGPTSLILSPTHQLYHNLVHGYQWGETSAIRWVADSHVIYANHPVDWDALLAVAAQQRMVVPVRHGLELLRREFRLTIPPEVQFRLANLPVSRREQTYFRLLNRRSDNLLMKSVQFLRKNGLAYQLFQRGRARQPLRSWLYDTVKAHLAGSGQPRPSAKPALSVRRTAANAGVTG